MYAWLSAILKKRYQIKVHTTNSINAIAMNHIPPWRNDVITEDVVHGIEIVGYNLNGINFASITATIPITVG